MKVFDALTISELMQFMLMPLVTTVILMFMPLVDDAVVVKYVTKTKFVRRLLLVIADWL